MLALFFLTAAQTVSAASMVSLAGSSPKAYGHVTDFVLAKAKVSDKALPFDELMAQAQA